ncbi:MAG TPA: trehalose-6-phosphate synthase [Gemmataceae bacterium]|nr:trehalose-6-phosphate synthase [Gemmataceae bacterium]
MAWTKERLEDVVRTRLAGARLVVVANREPFIHVYDGGDIRCMRPASGVTTALDPVMRACGGVWVGHGSGDADRAASDDRGRVAVPPDDPSYTLRRIWLGREEEEGYYYGFANAALWPLCHAAYTRPRFEAEHWKAYRRVNRKFTEAVLEEVENEPAVVFVQDYHFALLPRMLRQARPDLVIVQFWHIPWPNPEVFRVCPWKEEILDGLLGNDLLAFHTQYHCNNFLETVDRHLEARACFERFAVTRRGQTTSVRPQPISVDPDEIAGLEPDDFAHEERRLRMQLRVGNLPLLLGVDRVDYIKGIPERLRAVDRLLCKHPQWRRKFCFVQVGAPSRTHIGDYRALNEEVSALVEEINWRHGDGSWDPIVFLHEHHGPDKLYMLYRMAAACVVTSLHDGMNLVSKEFVAARTDERGALILSEFTGAARELTDALIVNPYAIDEVAEAYQTALTMPAGEQQRRMRRMRRQVADNNIYRWAGMLLSAAGQLVEPEGPYSHRRGARQLHDNGVPLLKLSVT